jgi:hypothetical protein
VLYPRFKYAIAFVIGISIFSVSISCYANNAKLSFVPETSENLIKLALVIDHAEKIAGMKVTIAYDNNHLTFIKAEKSPITSSFMHVTNDKNPGKLIIVMASARGISGENIPLIHLEFTKSLNTDRQTQKISVIQIQLMDENLQEIQADYPEYTF